MLVHVILLKLVGIYRGLFLNLACFLIYVLCKSNAYISFKYVHLMYSCNVTNLSRLIIYTNLPRSSCLLRVFSLYLSVSRMKVYLCSYA